MRTFRQAEILWKAERFCGAANRTYYALYQAVVALFCHWGFTPKRLSVGREFDPEEPGRWAHSCVIRESRKRVYGAHQLLDMAFALRCKADYTGVPVTREQVAGVMDKVPPILKELQGKGVAYADDSSPSN